MILAPVRDQMSLQRASPAMTDALVLVTGGAGYIGSHTCLCLQNAGYQVLIIDDLSNSHHAVVGAIGGLSGRMPLFEQADIRDAKAMTDIVQRYRPCAAIHFAGVKSVAESTRDPRKYYEVNLGGTLALLGALASIGSPRVVFSSSATVYGDPDALPLKEAHPLRPRNAYGRSKMMVELVLADLCAADAQASAVALRYFNPAGAHETGTLGENPRGAPENLMPYLAQVATGAIAQVTIFGDDYPTHDGTGVRDYVHVMDLAEAHVAALGLALAEPGMHIANIGTGVGVSVLELIQAYAQSCGHALPQLVAARRAGDVAVSYADPSAAHTMLGWKAHRDLKQMCDDAHRYARHCAGHIAIS
jgi:UDP-glucose 4-epimerase